MEEGITAIKIQVKVKFRFDLGSFLGSFFQPNIFAGFIFAKMAKIRETREN